MSHRLMCALVVVLGISACSTDDARGPTAPDLQVTGAACNYNDVKKFARNLFGANSTQYDFAQEMSRLAANSPAATAKAFDIFAAVAAKRDAGSFSAQNVDDAANLTVQVIACANVAVSDAFSVATFTQALQGFGGYQVRGGGGSESQVVTTKNMLSGIAPPFNVTFATWLGGRALLYARAITTFSVEASGGRAYNWSIVRPALAGGALPALSAPGRVAICVDDPTLDGPSATISIYRIQHQAGALNTILPFDPATGLSLGCPPTLPPPPVFSMTQQFYRWLSPAPLYAAAAVRSTSPTGSPGAFSPFEVVTPGTIQISFDYPPADGPLAGPIPSTTPDSAVSVLITGQNGTAWQGTTVRIFGVNNNGAKDDFSNAVAMTNEFGRARFPGLTAPKVGGYTIYAETQATGNISAFEPATVQAPARINIRP
jgi:hypothetical protein